MDSFNYSNARAQLSLLMDKAISGYPTEITRRGKESAVLISKATYEAYKKAEFEKKIPKDRELS
ncbi:type II toxin-antitoxin system Phd/YefM family antitoxin [Acinetobacter pittii]|uniref:type II toxin-antitoxin system Phd/YefM family antitoxin n=1 Tax=Acinetobacter pittii TaxID=48296 RepID=UPI0026ED64AB|nr:type II toxin-antitoxin system Phd/YefM family antitoxin [Acinetobacter pittii]MDO7243199.1 type II toxin-antitoxin system Phd/YefM family antitoxin [Acinetobacter pittii]